MVINKKMPISFKKYVDSVRARSAYLYDEAVDISEVDNELVITVHSEQLDEAESIAKDVAYLFYREMIREETSEIRAALWA